jgi:uncharacterized membrane protein
VPKENSRAAMLTGVALAGTGIAHFVAPQMFDSITRPAFPRNTRNFIYVNGGIETAVGLGLAVQKTRKAAVLGLVGYVSYLVANSVRNR